MNEHYENNFDLASEYIMNLQLIIKNNKKYHKSLEMGFIQQCLDEQSLYIKKMPHVLIC